MYLFQNFIIINEPTTWLLVLVAGIGALSTTVIAFSEYLKSRERVGVSVDIRKMFTHDGRSLGECIYISVTNYSTFPITVDGFHWTPGNLYKFFLRLGRKNFSIYQIGDYTNPLNQGKNLPIRIKPKDQGQWVISINGNPKYDFKGLKKADKKWSKIKFCITTSTGGTYYAKKVDFEIIKEIRNEN